ncbi:MAG: hypothetical protein ACFFEN_09230 [Candidatus Thorarchaeota archaeon]
MNEKRKNKPLLFFNGAVEYLDKFSTQELLESNPINENNFNANFLRDTMLDELNNLKNIIAPDLKLEALSEADKEIFRNFINFYSICPVCGSPNHYFNLKRIYFDDNKQNLVKELIRLMNTANRKFRNYNLNFGVLCCNCFKKTMQD